MSEFSFGQVFQDEMLALMIRDYGFAIKASKYIPIERLYSDSHKYLFGKIKEKIESDGSTPSLLEVDDGLKYIERAKRKILRIFINKIYNLVPTDIEYIKDCLTEYSKKTLFVDIFQQAQTLWNTGKHDSTYEYTLKGINEIFNISYREDINISIEEFEEYRQRFITASTTTLKRIPTNISTLDNVLGGGLAKTEMGIILGDKKSGKSIGLIHMGASALMSRSANIAHFVLEGSTEQTLMRYQSRLTRIDYNRIKQDKLSEEEQEKLNKVGEEYIDRLELIPFNLNWEYTVKDIEGKIIEMRRRGKSLDLVIVDYGDLLTVKNSNKYMEYRHKQTEVYRGLKTIAMMYKVALWTASQVSKPKDDPERETLLRAKNASESYEKARITDLLITLNQTPREKEMGMMRILIDLYRDNESDIVMRVIQDYSRMIFYSKVYGYISPSELSTHGGRK